MKAYIIVELFEPKGFSDPLKTIFFNKQRALRYLVEKDNGVLIDTKDCLPSRNTIVKIEKNQNQTKRIVSYRIDELETEELSTTVEDIINKETFPISCLSREDLDERGFDSSKVSDAMMQRIADKLGDDYCEQLFWLSLDIIAEGEDCPKRFDSDEERIKEYIKSFGGESGVLDLEEGPSWTFYDSDNVGYTDRAVKLANAEDDTVDVLWRGERGSKDTWEKLTDSPNDNDTVSFLETLVEALEEEFGEL